MSETMLGVQRSPLTASLAEKPFCEAPLIFSASKLSSSSPRVVYTSNRGAAAAGFNLSYKVDDNPEHVDANHSLLKTLVGLPVSLLQQVHSARVVDLDEVVAGIGRGNSEGIRKVLKPLASQKADAQVSSRSDIALAIFTGDCTPILLADSSAGIYAAAHAGRKGTADGVVPATVAAMVAKGAQPSNIEVWLGPNICAQCYETGEEVAREFSQKCSGFTTLTRFGGVGIDMRAALLFQLGKCGVVSTNIHDADLAISAQTKAALKTHPNETKPAIANNVTLAGANSMCTLENPLLYSYREWTLTHRPGSNGRFLSILIPN